MEATESIIVPGWARKEIACTWSGGIDSTALLALLLKAGWEVRAYVLNFYGSKMVERERHARNHLIRHLKAIKASFTIEEVDGNFLWAFSPDGIEIPRRNRLIIDHLIESFMNPAGIYYLALGEYIGVDSWVVKDHVGGADADARALTAYIYQEYGLDYRLLTLSDFGEARFKKDRVKLGWDILGENMFLTTNCLYDFEEHCGACYKCIERHAAFTLVAGRDETIYTKNPEDSPLYEKYLKQMTEAK
jgi:7-cyano-7-deazaguanine synthase in queuosine biosynthesis